MTSTDTVKGDGILAEKTVAQNGSPSVRVVENLTGVPCTELEARAAKIAPPR